jgi:DNA-binding transcriptional ArsR family regulator
LYFAVVPLQSWPSFPAYIAHLESMPPAALRDKMLDAYARLSWKKGSNADCIDENSALTIFEKGHILASFENYITFLRERFDESHIEEALESMQSLIVGHLRYMWEKYLEPEWQIERQLLLSSVNAFQQIDLNAMDPLEAARLVTGQDLEDEKWKPFIERSDEIVFVPSAHIGPFLWRWGYQRKSYLMFGARQPAGMLHDAPDLSRAEIIVRLTALADDSRLRILRYLAENGEQRAQEIIQRLELSQSAVSRHLQQLTATGYISERRCDGGKCYRLNSERITDTLNAIGVYLDTSPEPPQPEIISVPRERRHQRL